MTDGRAGGSRVRTVFLGSGAFGVPSAASASAAHPDVELVGVVTAPPRPAGRGAATDADRRSTRRAASSASAPILTPGAAARTRRRSPPSWPCDPALAVLADYGQIVPPALLDLPHGALNLHPSLLPRHRGATPIPATILAGDAETGVTLMRMDAGLDTGPIVAQRARAARRDRDGAGARGARWPASPPTLLAGSLGPWLARRARRRARSRTTARR